MAVGKNITRGKGERGSIIVNPNNIGVVGKHIKWGKGEGDRSFGEEN